MENSACITYHNLMEMEERLTKMIQDALGGEPTFQDPIRILISWTSFFPTSVHDVGSGQDAPRITVNLKQNLQFLRLLRDFQKRKSSTPRPSTSYRKKKAVKQELPEDIDLYQDPTTNLYYTSQGLDTAVPVLLVDGYNVCGYWKKLKKHFIKGRLDIARQKLTDELITFSVLKEVKVVVVFDALMSGLPTHKENFAGYDQSLSRDFSRGSCMLFEVVAYYETECKKIFIFKSSTLQQNFAYQHLSFVIKSEMNSKEFKEYRKERKVSHPNLLGSLKILKGYDRVGPETFST
ncbi:hypothetical protein MA16_Dca022237 [Dendrobium catenatum]|uniref:NYN domain-containing protein n=1 Tax=Dendrobium catenatum TaxID=906689 RepID=A0A2I0X9U7_9ASPA|nr:hypothetical protein MA16_Dca022237 [Dendrobium catenatum]